MNRVADLALELAELAEIAGEAVADLADEGVFGAKGTAEFARSADWRTEADRILARIKS